MEEFCICMANELEIIKKVSDILVKDSDKLSVSAENFLLRNTEILIILQEIKLVEKSETKEWEKLLLEAVKEIVCTDSVYNDFWEEYVIKYCFDDLLDYLQIHKGKFIKLVAIPEIKEMLDSEKQN